MVRPGYTDGAGRRFAWSGLLEPGEVRKGVGLFSRQLQFSWILITFVLPTGRDPSMLRWCLSIL